MDTPNPSEVAIWLEQMGFNGKQVSAAAEQIGLSGRQLTRKRDGEAELTLQDRLAMAAARAGLQPWTPETDRDLAMVRALRDRAGTMATELHAAVDKIVGGAD